MAVDWGNVPAWVGTGVAGVALVFAAIAAFSARRASQLQSVQLEELRAENRRRDGLLRREMASKVTVYVSLKGSDSMVPIVHFINSGDLPIYGMTIYVFTPTVLVERTYFVNGASPERRTMGAISERVLEVLDGAKPGTLIGRGQLVAACSFRDAGGQWWCRKASGELQEATCGDEAATLARGSGPTTWERVELIADSD